EGEADPGVWMEREGFLPPNFDQLAKRCRIGRAKISIEPNWPPIDNIRVRVDDKLLGRISTRRRLPRAASRRRLGHPVPPPRRPRTEQGYTIYNVSRERERRTDSAVVALRMHVLGEPFGRQLVPEPAVLGLAVDYRAGGGELVAEPDIVEKAGDLAVGLAALCAAGDQVGHGGEPIEVDAAAPP